MKIIADENIPYAKEAFAELGEVTTLPGRNMKSSDLVDCECLLVRSITKVNQQLLHNTAVKFVASATIGTDHIDLEYLDSLGIGFANAPGCNAESASEYMINALFQLAEKKGFNPFDLTAGIIGCGNVGSRVKQKLDILGIKTLVNDPPLQLAGKHSYDFDSLETIIEQCDFITCHVPLTKSGHHPTVHLLDEQKLNKLNEGCILFNAARGPVIDNQALSQLLLKRSDLTVFLDTWEGEPAINQTLLRQVDFATPHIAGYSVEGRLRGTQMILAAACDFFNLPSKWEMQHYLPKKLNIKINESQNYSIWFQLFKAHYSIDIDHQKLLALAEMPKHQLAIEFDLLRKNYPHRYEYDHYRIQGVTDIQLALMIKKLAFLAEIVPH